MKMISTFCATAAFFALSLAFATSTANAAPSKTYQVTGPVTDLNAKTITVVKGKEKFEIARVTETDLPNDLKVGDKVTVTYFMTATNVEKKAAKKAEKK